MRPLSLQNDEFELRTEKKISSQVWTANKKREFNEEVSLHFNKKGFLICSNEYWSEYFVWIFFFNYCNAVQKNGLILQNSFCWALDFARKMLTLTISQNGPER